MTYKDPGSFPPDHINRGKDHPLKEFAVLVSGLAVVALLTISVLFFFSDRLVVMISPEQELEYGASWYSSGVNEADDGLAELRNLVSSLGYSAGGESFPKLYVRVSKSSQPNAFMYPGGLIEITSGLIEKVESENELSFVIAHEMGHFAHRDSLRAMGRLAMTGLFLSFVGIGSGDASLFNIPTKMLQLQYGRGQEREADAFALNVLWKYYGHLNGAQDFFSRLAGLESLVKSEQLQKILSYSSTHPLNQERISRIEEIAKRNSWPLEGELTPVSSEIKALTTISESVPQEPILDQ